MGAFIVFIISYLLYNKNMEQLKDFRWDLLIAPAVYILVGILIYLIIRHSARRIIIRSERRLKDGGKRRLETIQNLILSVIKIVIATIVILAILGKFGVDVSSLVAGLGIMTAVVGLALQDLGKNIVAGFGIILDGDFALGDVVNIDGFEGTVITMGLRTTKIQDYCGQIKTISNRNISSVVNYSDSGTLARVDVGTPYGLDPKKIEVALKNVKKRVDGHFEEYITGPVDILGIESLGESSVIWRVEVLCKPYCHFQAERILNREIMDEFTRAKIDIPFPQLTVHQARN